MRITQRFAMFRRLAENIARQLFADMAPLFSDVQARLCVCHLSESPERSATYYFNGDSEANYWFEFSAARRTMSPLLSAAGEHKAVWARPLQFTDIIIAPGLLFDRNSSTGQGAAGRLRRN